MSAKYMINDIIGNLAAGMEVTQMSQLEMWIAQSCDSLIHASPNLGLNLEICDLINKQGKTAPRDAAFAIARQINYSSSSAYLALTLLDNCAKNCGYPFHIVISSKEFLNELVRKFPESPKNVTATQRKILDLIAEWNVVYAQKSRYKQDFKHINDMYRLLEYKGYKFPYMDDSKATNFEPDVNLKTEEELENEDRINNGTKLEDLIRKGTPAALAEANDMMKLMSGYDTSKKPDYRKQVNEELDRIESKVILLNDMLNQSTNRKTDSTVEDLHSSAKVAQSRLQKFIADNEDEDRLARLLELNDLINTVLKKYADLKAGKEVERNDLDRKKTKSSKDNSQKDTGLINLIDFDDFAASTSNSTQAPFSFDPFASQLSQQNAGTPQQTNIPQSAPGNLLDELGALNFGNPSFNPPTMQQPNNIMTGGSAISGLKSLNHPITGVISNTQAMPQNMGSGSFHNASQQQPLMILPSNSGPSNNFIQQSKPKASAFDDLFGAAPINSAQPTSTASKPTDLLGDFSAIQSNSVKPLVNSQVPLITKENVIFNQNGLQIKLTASSPTTTAQIHGSLVFNNITPVQFSDLNFMISLPKTMSIQLEPLSATTLQPFNQAPAYQKFTISNPAKENLRLRFKVQYGMNGAHVSEQGEFSS